MCRVKSCCCGCSLKTGAITCCVFTALAALSNIGPGIFFLHRLHELENVENEKLVTVKNNSSEELTEDGDMKTAITVYRVFAGFACVNGLLLVVGFICLLFGIIKRNAGSIMVWLVVELMQITFNFFLAVIGFLSGDYIEYGVSALIGNTLSGYFWIVVISYYYELRDGGNRLMPSTISKNV